MPKRKQSEITPDLSWVNDHVAAASIAYKNENFNDPTDKVKLDQSWQFYKTIKGKSGVQLKIWTSPKNGNVLVSFRGTSSAKELRLDATIGSSVFRNSRGENVGYLYKGFAIGWEDIKPQLEDELKFLKDTGNIPDGSILQFSGHSLGGSLAEVASTYFSDVYPNAMVFETSIGAPSTGDKHFADYSRSRVNLNRTRIVAAGDPIANAKLPGMEFTETKNVINFMHKKGNGAKLWDNFVKTISLTSPGIAIANHLYDQANNHTLSAYTDTLVKDFQDSSILTLQDDPDVEVDNQEDSYQQSRESTNIIDDGSCSCECHTYDAAIVEGKVPPQSLGLTPQMANPTNAIPAITLNQNPNPQVQNATNNDIQQSKNAMEIDEMQTSESQLIAMDNEEFMDAVNEGLDKQKNKAQEEIKKLQEKYASLTNQQDDEADPVTLERNRYSKASEDIQYFENRIDMEIQYPQYVPSDSGGSTTSRDRAVAFKNKLNRIYSLIMQNKSQKFADTLDPSKKDDKPTEEQETRNMVSDQSEQIAEALKDNQLDPDKQPNNYIFDLDMLPDLDDTESPKSVKQIQEWMSYSGMTSNSLYDQLKTIAVNDYKMTRLKELRENEQNTRVTAAEDIKKKISAYTNPEGTGSFDVTQKARKNLMVKLGSDPRFMKMYKEGKVDINKVIEDYKGEADDDRIMTSLLGYKTSSVDEMKQAYYKQFADNMPRLDAQSYAENMMKTQQVLNANLKYPWINPKSFGSLYELYKNDPTELAKQAASLQPAMPASYAVVSNPGEDMGIDKEILSKQVEALPDSSGNIKNVSFKDAFSEEKKKLEEKYNNVSELKDLFKKWNNYDENKDDISTMTDALTGGFFTNKMFHAWEKLANGNKAVSGWFSKDGTWLGYAASPDFEEYARKHPDLGYKYVGPTTNQFLDVMDSVNDMAGQYAAQTYGINPNELRDGIEDKTGITNKTKYDTATGVLDGGGEDDAEENKDLTDAFNPMGMMMYMNNRRGGDDNDMKGETNPKNRGNNRSRVNTNTNNGRFNTTDMKLGSHGGTGRRGRR